MNIVIERSTIAYALELLTRIVRPKRTPLPTRVALHAEAPGRLVLRITDLDELDARMTLEADVRVPGDRSFDAKRLLAVARSFESDTIEIRASRPATAILIDGDRPRRMQIGARGPDPRSDRAEITELVTTRLRSTDLSRTLKATSPAIARRGSRRGAMESLIVEVEPSQIRTIATDGWRLFTCSSPTMDPYPARQTFTRQTFYLHRAQAETFSALAGLAETWSLTWSAIAGTNQRILASLEGGPLVVEAEVTTEEPIDWRYVLPVPFGEQDPKKTTSSGGAVVLERRALRRALKRATLVSDSSFKVATFVPHEAAIEILAAGRELGQEEPGPDAFNGLTETLDAQILGAPGVFHFQPRLLDSVLQATRTDRVRLDIGGALSPILISEVGGDGRFQGVIISTRPDDKALVRVEG